MFPEVTARSSFYAFWAKAKRWCSFREHLRKVAFINDKSDNFTRILWNHRYWPHQRWAKLARAAKRNDCWSAPFSSHFHTFILQIPVECDGNGAFQQSFLLASLAEFAHLWWGQYLRFKIILAKLSDLSLINATLRKCSRKLHQRLALAQNAWNEDLAVTSGNMWDHFWHVIPFLAFHFWCYFYSTTSGRWWACHFSLIREFSNKIPR